MPCEKHGPRASVTTKTSAFGLGFCLLSPSGHVFHTARETMIKSYSKYIVIITSKRRRFGVMMTPLLRRVPLGSEKMFIPVTNAHQIVITNITNISHIMALCIINQMYLNSFHSDNDISCTKQFLPQDVAFSIHLSDNRFTARPLATTVVSPPRK